MLEDGKTRRFHEGNWVKNWFIFLDVKLCLNTDFLKIFKTKSDKFLTFYLKSDSP